MDDEDDRIPGLTRSERAAELGLTFAEHIELEQAIPTVGHWSWRWRHGAVNMGAWLAAGRPTADLGRLCMSGAPSMIRAIVERLPTAVQWHLVQHVRIACTFPGLGITGPAPLPPPDERTSIVLPWTEPGLVCHEFAHAWQRDPALFANLTTAEIEELDEMVAARLGADESADKTDLSELAADCLASQWLGRKVDTSGPAGPRGRRLSVRDIEGTLP